MRNGIAPVPICEAVQHAHQKGIIHRDLKPSNILVAMYDNKAVPKIIDFGVAKATSQTLTEKTMFTQLGQIVGTLEYMSPEQALRNQLDVDTRSDIYSLGVVLYELLTGETPFDRVRLRSVAFDEMLRIIREEEPSKPSTKVSSSQLLPSIAAHRRMEPAKLGRTIRGELDWIVMKALEKDRARRYETAVALAADLQKYLNDEPVTACPPSRWYLLRKFTRRNRAAMLVTAFVVATLVLAISGVTWQTFHALRADAEASRAKAEATAARIEARSENHLAALAELGDGHQRLQSPTPGKKHEILTKVLPKVIARRKKIDDQAILSDIDYGIRSLWLATQASYDAEQTAIGELPKLDQVSWPAAIHPGGRSVVIGARTRPYALRPGERIDIPASEATTASKVRYAASGRYVAFAAPEGSVAVWDEQVTKRLAEWTPAGPIAVLDLMFDSADHTLRDREQIT